jgi:hypothetical protein
MNTPGELFDSASAAVGRVDGKSLLIIMMLQASSSRQPGSSAVSKLTELQRGFTVTVTGQHFQYGLNQSNPLRECFTSLAGQMQRIFVSRHEYSKPDDGPTNAVVDYTSRLCRLRHASKTCKFCTRVITSRSGSHAAAVDLCNPLTRTNCCVVVTF